ncbi:hypothetical protein, partial [Actinophytocola sp.]|uniref:hypothetical protein n=1 Tax=Actinophytocola sp. TaxID=1872138 RepID=UPI002D7FCFCF
MDIASETLLRLADPAARGGVLTGDALLAIVTVAYELDPALVTEPASAIFDRFDLAVPLGSQVTASATFRRTGEPVPWEVAAAWDTVPIPGADAVWAGAIVVRTATVSGTIVEVSAVHSGPDALTATVRMSPSGEDPAPAPVALPVVISFVTTGAGADPRALLRASRLARLAAAPYPLAAGPAGAPARRVDRLVCWVVPATVFDDPGWPGAAATTTPDQQRADRLRAARAWLAGQGVAVITTE